MTDQIKPGQPIKGLHIKLLDKTLEKAFSNNGNKPLRLLINEVDTGDEHFSLDLEILEVLDIMPQCDDIVELNKMSAFELNFDYDLSTFLGRRVAVVTSTASRLFNALFVPFYQIECVVDSLGSDWKIALTEITEREDDLDPADFEEIKY